MMRRDRTRPLGVRTVALSAILAVLLWDGTAYALNAVVSQDLPILTQQLAVQLESKLKLAAILAETSAIVAQVKEYTTLAKTAYRGIEELQTLDIDQIRDGVMEGLASAYPEVAQMRGDLNDIRDLRYSDPHSVAVLRGILWEKIYGPGLAAIRDAAESNLESAAVIAERKTTHSAYVKARRQQWDKWQDQCERDGAGACQRASDSATVEQTQLLGDVHETLLWSTEIQSREQLRQDRQEVARAQQVLRWMRDVEAYVAGKSGAAEQCKAGECMWERHGSKAPATHRYQSARRPYRELAEGTR
jgi:hypothetical protein